MSSSGPGEGGGGVGKKSVLVVDVQERRHGRFQGNNNGKKSSAGCCCLCTRRSQSGHSVGIGTNCQVRDNFDGKIVLSDGWEPNLLGVDEQWTPYGYQKVNLRKELTNFTQKWAEEERSGVVSEEN